MFGPLSLVKLYKSFLKWSWPMLEHLKFWKYFTIFFPCKNFCSQITTEKSKFTKGIQRSVTSTFIEISEKPNSVLKIGLVLEVKDFDRLIKTRFYWKRDRKKLRKHAETFHAHNSYKLTTFGILYQLCYFQNRNMWYTFEMLPRK